MESYAILSAVASVFSHIPGLAGIFGHNNADAKKPVNFEVSTLWEPRKPCLDIVLVHGLKTNSNWAWSSSDTSTNSGFCWPTSALPQRLGANTEARILAYDYDNEFRTAEFLTCRTLLHQTIRLIEALAEHRKKDTTRPIIFICHSLGGIVVKNALASARACENKQLEDVYHATRGIVFLGTPHTSSPCRLGDSLCRILEIGADDKRHCEIHQFSTTLAYSLERFKPLASNLHICAVTEEPKLIRNDTDMEKPQNCQYHRHISLVRDHAELCKFSDADDKDLGLIIAEIRKICGKIRGLPAIDKRVSEEESLKETSPPLSPTGAKNKMSEDGSGKPLQRAIDNLRKEKGNNNPRATKKSKQLQRYFAKWASESDDLDAWPVAVLTGPAGRGKTQTALRYVCSNKDTYASIFWVNATNLRSLKASFREIADTITDDSGSSIFDAVLPVFKGIGSGGSDPSDEPSNELSDELSDEDFCIVVQAVTEWLVHPRKKPWLLVLDDLKLKSDHAAIWPGLDSCSKSKNQSWTDLLELLPLTTGKRGHIIISTRDTVDATGPEIISFTGLDRRGSVLSQANPAKPASEPVEISFSKRWGEASVQEKILLEFTLFLCDADCQVVPDFLLEALVDMPTSARQFPELEHRVPYYRLSESLAARGPKLLLGLTNSVDEFVTAAISRIKKALDEGIKELQNKGDVIFGWSFEAAIAQNIAALLRNLDKLQLGENTTSGKGLLRRFLDDDVGHWKGLAAICESHAVYAPARDLYEMERELMQDEQSPGGFALRLDCARVYQRGREYDKAEEEYKQIDNDYERMGDASDYKKLWIRAYRQSASMQASRGQYTMAVETVSEVLALEDPFGDDSTHNQITECVTELAMYLAKDGNEPAASAILQRILISLNKTRGEKHSATLAAMEALSTIKLRQEEYVEARSLMKKVYESQKERLGDEHPVSIRCLSKMAAMWEMGGDARRAETEYSRCLKDGDRSLGRCHPSLFRVREDYAHFLITQGKKEEAKAQAKSLTEMKHLLGSDAVSRIDCIVQDKVNEEDARFVRRRSLDMGILYNGL
ncbi:hypothetical protein NM208_g3629 [Fusarium decemcellulare]|uniref:Uncharacterized protein n=1 Tax=Fusarium decemcellulare TaxID=57161 RepID=A0ACC1SNC2_9HYPO|nr:hypothetical protein NM208_g3629 [Fusarium decemcellulare]